MIARICLDLDGVLCDFTTAAICLHGKDPDEVYGSWPRGEWSIEKALGLKTWKFWSKVNKAGFEFWSSLPAYRWAADLVELCKATAPMTIVTSPSYSAASAKGKILWLQKEFGREFREYLIGPPKHLVARPGVVLIDDCDANAERFVEAGGAAITFPRIWNKLHSQADDPMKHVITLLNNERRQTG